MSGNPSIKRVRVRNFGCVQECTLSLTPLHALVGPNDSGKSTLLRAIAASQAALRGNAGPFHVAGREVELEWSDKWGVKIWGGTEPVQALVQWRSPNGSLGSPGGVGLRPSGAPLRGENPRLVRLDPDEMRKPSRLIPSNRGVQLGERGTGLPAVYDALLARKRKAFDMIEEQVRTLFPQVEALVLSSVSESEKQLAVQLVGRSEPVSAPDLSEGMLYFWAFKALPHLEPTSVVLVEEPENGLHPARIREVVAVLREVSKSTQVIVATHSPLVINELGGDEISIITRDDQGTHATLLSDTPRYEERASVYKNGEIWLSYGDGEQEAALLQGKPAP